MNIAVSNLRKEQALREEFERENEHLKDSVSTYKSRVKQLNEELTNTNAKWTKQLESENLAFVAEKTTLNNRIEALQNELQQIRLTSETEKSELETKLLTQAKQERAEYANKLKTTFKSQFENFRDQFETQKAEDLENMKVQYEQVFKTQLNKTKSKSKALLEQTKLSLRILFNKSNIRI